MMEKKKGIVTTKVDIARAFGVERGTIYGWVKRGMPVNEDGSFDLKAISKWRGKQLRSPVSEEQRAEVVALVENTKKSEKEIAEIVGLSQQSVSVIKRRYEEDKPLIDFVNGARANLMTAEQGRNLLIRQTIIDSISAEEVKNLGLKDKIDIYSKLGGDTSNIYKDERLERDKTTENVGAIIQFIQKVKREDKECQT